MASLYRDGAGVMSLYRDQHYQGSPSQMQKDLVQSTTLYVGNLSFYTTEEQIYELFSKTGEVKRIIMGLNRELRTPCGFCFVEYYARQDAEAAIKYINGTRLDDRMIRTDWDAGFREGRQYGRGRSGGQVRDEYRTDFDPGRGGYGKQRQKELERIERDRPRAGFNASGVVYTPQIQRIAPPGYQGPANVANYQQMKQSQEDALSRKRGREDEAGEG